MTEGYVKPTKLVHSSHTPGSSSERVPGPPGHRRCVAGSSVGKRQGRGVQPVRKQVVEQGWQGGGQEFVAALPQFVR